MSTIELVTQDSASSRNSSKRSIESVWEPYSRSSKLRKQLSVQVFAVQHVDVCMFTNGKFKNVVAMQNSGTECPLAPGGKLLRTYALRPAKSATKNWIALEDSFNRPGASLASTVVAAPSVPDDRNVFAIYVSYYVKVKLLLGAMGGELALKLPFMLVHPSSESRAAAAGAVAAAAAAAGSSGEVEEEQPAGAEGGASSSKRDEDLIEHCGADPP
ncbi:phosrestin-2-like [Schistocerca piceifrons]|uniref:phosrestin-2-like n=1 Tax=Schistocerca piceifrons TaxID=274613 RepID=UPI001F5ED9AD|nr:phosrestin-2-like [Schistocerca piceifrons]